MDTAAALSRVEDTITYLGSTPWTTALASSSSDLQSQSTATLEALTRLKAFLSTSPATQSELDLATTNLAQAQTGTIDAEALFAAAQAYFAVVDRSAGLLAQESTRDGVRHALATLEAFLAGSDWDGAVDGQADLTQRSKRLKMLAHQRYNAAVNTALQDVNTRLGSISGDLNTAAHDLAKIQAEAVSVVSYLNAATAFIGVLGQVLTVAAKL